MAVDDKELDKLIKQSGIGPRTAARMRKANDDQRAAEKKVDDERRAAEKAAAEKKPKARGHGSPSPHIADLGDDF